MGGEAFIQLDTAIYVDYKEDVTDLYSALLKHFLEELAQQIHFMIQRV